MAERQLRRRGAAACGGGVGWRLALPPCLWGGQRGRRRGRWWRLSARCSRPRFRSAEALCMHACQPPCAPVALCPHASRCSFPPSLSRCTDPRFATPPSSRSRPRSTPRPRRLRRTRSPLFSRSAPPSPSPAVCLCVCRQVEVWEGLAPQLELRSLVMLACTHRDLKTILDEANILNSTRNSALISHTGTLCLIYLLDS